MMEAELLSLGTVKALPVFEAGLQKAIGAQDIGLHEGRGTVDRAIDVRLGGQMHEQIGLFAPQELRHRRPVTDIKMVEAVADMPF